MRISNSQVLGVFFFLCFLSSAFTVLIGSPGSPVAYLPHAFVAICLIFVMPTQPKRTNLLVANGAVTLYFLYCMFFLPCIGVADGMYIARSISYLTIWMFLVFFGFTTNNTDYQRFVGLRVVFNFVLVGISLYSVAWILNSNPETTAGGVTRFSTSTFSGNAAGRNALYGAIITTVFLSYSETRGWALVRFASLLAIFLTVMVIAVNKTSLIAYAFVAFLVFSRGLQRERKVLFVLVFLAMAVYMAFFTQTTENMRALVTDEQSVSDIQDLTGRTNIWPIVIDMICQDYVRLLLGHGYGTADLVLSERVLWADVGHAHNAVLNALLETGIIGAILLHFVLLRNVRDSLLYARKNSELVQYHKIALFLSLAILLRGITEGAYAQIGAVDMCLMVVLYGFYRSLERRRVGIQGFRTRMT